MNKTINRSELSKLSGWIILLFLSVYHPRLLAQTPPDSVRSISGIYPHLAYYNDEAECGTGAVVPWADRLWVITYGPHLPNGSSDKLYEITPDLRMTVRPESVGGTPANRLVHTESQQLFIGPYVIDTTRQVRVIPYAEAPGRLTGTARHLTQPTEKVYTATMEEGFYEVDVSSLQTTSVSLAKAVYAWPQTDQDRKFFSLSSIKTQYFNEHLLRKFFSEFGIPPKPIKIRHSTKHYTTTAVLPLESLQTIAQ